MGGAQQGGDRRGVRRAVRFRQYAARKFARENVETAASQMADSKSQHLLSGSQKVRFSESGCSAKFEVHESSSLGVRTETQRNQDILNCKIVR